MIPHILACFPSTQYPVFYFLASLLITSCSCLLLRHCVVRRKCPPIVYHVIKSLVIKSVSLMGGSHPFLNSSYLGMLPFYSVTCILLFGFSTCPHAAVFSWDKLDENGSKSANCSLSREGRCRKGKEDGSERRLWDKPSHISRKQTIHNVSGGAGLFTRALDLCAFS